jgi:hypothetical protein
VAETIFRTLLGMTDEDLDRYRAMPSGCGPSASLPRICRPTVGIEGVRRNVGAVGPHDGASFRIDPDLPEHLVVFERLESRSPKQRSEVDVADFSRLKRQADDTVVENLDVGHVDHV